MTPRIAAYETLLRLEKEKQYSNIAVNHTIQKYNFEKQDREFYSQLVYGVVEKKLTLDYLVKQYTEKSPKRLDLSVLIILRLSFYQLFFLDRVPQSAAVSEGVKLAARFASRTKNYVNAILRKACREEPIYPSEGEVSRAEALSVKYSVNEDIVSLLLEQYPNQVDDILKGYNTIPTLALQVVSSHYTPQSFIAATDLSASTVPPLPFAVKFAKKKAISDIPQLESGHVFVQDIASQLTTLVLAPSADHFVIDVCSCPGGKTFSAYNWMLSRTPNTPLQGHILSCDIHESKLSLVENGAKKLGFTQIQTLCHDASEPLLEYIAKADRVICDVPCSGLGVINKKPEIRYKDIEEIHAISKIQYKILETSARYLKKGGVLVYSTCTLNREENEDVVREFLRNNTEYSFSDFEINGESFAYRSDRGCLTLLPNEIHDGFFIAKIIKT